MQLNVSESSDKVFIALMPSLSGQDKNSSDRKEFLEKIYIEKVNNFFRTITRL